MQVEAIFENIGDRIMEELDKAQVSIYISVAWLTNREIISVLQDKVERGCNLNVMYSNDEINRRTTDAFDLLKEKKANVYAVGNGDDELMHNKFCVIDHSTVITGSYNWSYKAENQINCLYGVG